MPSYVLTSRKRGESCKDTRLNGEGPWRKSEDVSACPRDLGTGMTEIHEEETLHEVQYSFHAECYDNNWTAISMVDTYHYYYDKENHDLLGYYEDPSSNDGMDWDPITIGSTSADLCPEEPEAYFFEVLRCRMEQVAQQSESNLLRLKRRIPKYVRWPIHVTRGKKMGSGCEADVTRKNSSTKVTTASPSGTAPSTPFYRLRICSRLIAKTENGCTGRPSFVPS